jgi:hypothetical protein
LSGWAKTFPRLCGAIAGRLTFTGQIIKAGASSFRLAHARGGQRPVSLSVGVGYSC